MLLTQYRRIGTEGSIEVARGVLARDVRRHGGDNPITVNRMMHLAECLRDAGQFDESIVLLREAVALLSEGLGPDDIQTAIAESELARSLKENKMDEESASLKRHAIEVLTRERGPEDGRVLTDSAALGGTLCRLRRYQEAEVLLDGLTPRLEKVFGPGNEWAIRSSAHLAVAQANQQKFRSAIELQRQVVEMNVTRYGVEHPRAQVARFNLAAYLHWARDDDEARLVAQAVLDMDARLGVDNDSTELARQLLDEIDRTGDLGRGT